MCYCGTFLLADNAARNLVAHDTDSSESTDPDGGNVLYQVVETWSAAGLDFENHSDGIVLPLLVYPVPVVRAATFHPCFGPWRTAHGRHCRSDLDFASPRHIHRIHPLAHWYVDIVHVEGYRLSAPLDFLGRSHSVQPKLLEKTHTRAGGLRTVAFVGLHVVVAERMP